MVPRGYGYEGVGEFDGNICVEVSVKVMFIQYTCVFVCLGDVFPS